MHRIAVHRRDVVGVAQVQFRLGLLVQRVFLGRHVRIDKLRPCHHQRLLFLLKGVLAVLVSQQGGIVLEIENGLALQLLAGPFQFALVEIHVQFGAGDVGLARPVRHFLAVDFAADIGEVGLGVGYGNFIGRARRNSILPAWTRALSAV